MLVVMRVDLRGLAVVVVTVGSLSVVDGGCRSTVTNPGESDSRSSDATTSDARADATCPPKPSRCVAPSGAEDALACYAPCSTDADCADPCEPFCRIQGLPMGGDYLCNGTIRVCHANRLDDCS